MCVPWDGMLDYKVNDQSYRSFPPTGVHDDVMVSATRPTLLDNTVLSACRHTLYDSWAAERACSWKTICLYTWRHITMELTLHCPFTPLPDAKMVLRVTSTLHETGGLTLDELPPVLQTSRSG